MSDPYGIARQGAQATNMINSLKKEITRTPRKRVGNMPVRKTQPFRVGTNQPVTNMPVGSPRPVVPSRPSMELMKKKAMATEARKMRYSLKQDEMMKKNNNNKKKADMESMKKADYSRVIEKRLAKKNTSKTLKKMVSKKSAKNSYRIGNGPNRASY